MKAHWSLKRLGDIFEIARGGSPRPIEKFITSDPNGLNWIKIGDASASGKLIERTKDKIKPEGLSKTRAVSPGDFLLTNSMSFGRPYIMATDGCIHDGWLVLKPRVKELVHPDYFYYLLSSDEIYQKFASRAGGSTVRNLNTEIVSSVEVRLPPIDEQRRIAAILDKADALRRKRRQALELLNELTQSIFMEIFGDPIANPKDWPTLKLEQVIDTDRGISYGVVQRGDDRIEGIPIVRISDIVLSLIDTTGLKKTTPEIANRYKRTSLLGGEILISIRGTVGLTAVVPPTLSQANVSREIAVIPIRRTEMSPFYEALLNQPSVQDRLQRDVRGIAQRGINLADLRKLSVIQPGEAQIEAFVDARAKLLRLRTGLKTRFGRIEEMFSSLQSRAFSGRL